jgi:hypothetical protein
MVIFVFLTFSFVIVRWDQRQIYTLIFKNTKTRLRNTLHASAHEGLLLSLEETCGFSLNSQIVASWILIGV